MVVLISLVLAILILPHSHIFSFVLDSEYFITSRKKFQSVPLNAWDYNNQNIYRNQWKLFTSGLRSWNGYWIRYSVDGKITENTFVKRKFNHIYPNLIVQTNVYSNLNFSVNDQGKSKTRFMCIHKLPVIQNFYSLNGDADEKHWTDTEEQANNILSGAFLMFYPPYFTVLGFNRMYPSSYFFFEKFVRPSLLPFNFRLSITPVYVGRILSIVSLAREVSAPQLYSKNSFWLYNRKSFVMVFD